MERTRNSEDSGKGANREYTREELELLIAEKQKEIEYLEARNRRISAMGEDIEGLHGEERRVVVRKRKALTPEERARRAARAENRENEGRREVRRRPEDGSRRAEHRREAVQRREESRRRDDTRRREEPRRAESERTSQRRAAERKAAERKPVQEPEYEETVEIKGEKTAFSERFVKIIGALVGLIIVILVVLVLFGGKLSSKLSSKFNINLDLGNIGGKELASEGGVTNILLIGQDGREDVEGSRSDSMMIMSVNKSKGTVKLVSLMRDMYVSIPGHDDNRINAAYSFGGVDLLKKTVEQNFKVKIDGNVQIDFESFMTVIDKIGGVNIELSQEEADYLNYAYWQNGWELTGGVQNLNGAQALAYSRIRQVGNSDFERTERQRKVLMTIFRQVKGQGKVAMLSFAKDVYPLLDTSVGLTDMINLATAAMNLDESKIETYRLPVDGAYTPQTIRNMAVLVPDLEKNQAYLKELLFGND